MSQLFSCRRFGSICADDVSQLAKTFAPFGRHNNELVSDPAGRVSQEPSRPGSDSGKESGNGHRLINSRLSQVMAKNLILELPFVS